MVVTEQVSQTNRRRGWLGWPGLTVALLAFAIAAGSPWLAKLLDPPEPTFEQAAVEVAARLKDRIAAKLRGEQYEAPPKPAAFRWSRWLPGLAVGAGVLGCSFGVLGLVRREDGRLCGSAVAVGAGAVVF